MTVANLTTTYMGLELRNPVIVASSHLTSTLEQVITCEKAGAGAVVLKSLFEEQIHADSQSMIGDMNASVHTDALDYFRGESEYYYLDEYLKLVQEAKKKVSIPIIASLNCVSAGQWLEYANRFETVGADALELNVFIMPANVDQDGRAIEKIYLDIVKAIKKQVSIPVAVKLGPHFSGLANMLRELTYEGVNGLVLFNRFYRPDVDIEKLEIKAASVLSTPSELHLSLQWIALLSGELKVDFSAATGIHDGAGMVKQLLVGASTVQVCSAFMKNGVEHIQSMLKELEDWMDRHGYKSIEDFQGKLCQENIEQPEVYERNQYIKALVGIG